MLCDMQKPLKTMCDAFSLELSFFPTNIKLLCLKIYIRVMERSLDKCRAT